jgi:hypothetical protein
VRSDLRAQWRVVLRGKGLQRGPLHRKRQLPLMTAGSGVLETRPCRSESRKSWPMAGLRRGEPPSK